VGLGRLSSHNFYLSPPDIIPSSINGQATFLNVNILKNMPNIGKKHSFYPVGCD